MSETRKKCEITYLKINTLVYLLYYLHNIT